MNHEMLPADIFTRPRGWRDVIHIKHLLSDDNNIIPEEINVLGKKIAKELRETTILGIPLFKDKETLEALEAVDDLEEFNTLLDAMYDECDRVRILVK